MASITPYTFHFEGRKLPAVVSMNGSEDPIIHVEFFDDLTINHTPLKHLRYTGFNGYKTFPGFEESHMKAFIELIGKDIEEKFKRSKPIKFLFFLSNTN